MTVFGTRPEAVKMAPVIHRLREKGVDVCNVISAQHREMLDQILRLFDITADHDLDIMTHDQTLTSITSKALDRLAPIMESEKPDVVLVQGDTTTTFASGLSAFYHKIKVGHIEAGLRTWNKHAPFPEEVNRSLTGVIADYHFAPTEQARDNLLKLGVAASDIFVSGNTVIDALLEVADKPSFPLGGIDELDGRIIMMTAHRRESFGEPMRRVFKAVVNIVENFPDVHVVYPVHMNPNVQSVADEILKGHPQIHLLPPLDYHPLVSLMKRSYLVLTDSGGIQEEAPSLGKPVLVLRDVTEREEGVTAGTARLVGTDYDKIVSEVSRLLTDQSAYDGMARAVSPYGDGHAAERIVDVLLV